MVYRVMNPVAFSGFSPRKLSFAGSNKKRAEHIPRLSADPSGHLSRGTETEIHEAAQLKAIQQSALWQTQNNPKYGPYGAVIVKDNRIIAKSPNQVINLGAPMWHAEICAIDQATEELSAPGSRKPGDLKGATLYASTAPCIMCYSAAVYAGIKKIYYANSDAANYDVAKLDQDNFIRPDLRKPLEKRQTVPSRHITSSEQKQFLKNKPEYAVITDDQGKVIGKGDSQIQQRGPIWHPVMMAILKACTTQTEARKEKPWHLDGTTLYTSRPLCPMCYRTANNAHIALIVYKPDNSMFIQGNVDRIDQEYNPNKKRELAVVMTEDGQVIARSNEDITRNQGTNGRKWHPEMAAISNALQTLDKKGIKDPIPVFKTATLHANGAICDDCYRIAEALDISKIQIERHDTSDVFKDEPNIVPSYRPLEDLPYTTRATITNENNEVIGRSSADPPGTLEHTRLNQLDWYPEMAVMLATLRTLATKFPDEWIEKLKKMTLHVISYHPLHRHSNRYRLPQALFGEVTYHWHDTNGSLLEKKMPYRFQAERDAGVEPEILKDIHKDMQTRTLIPAVRMPARFQQMAKTIFENYAKATNKITYHEPPQPKKNQKK